MSGVASTPETCSLCHGAGQLADAITLHQASAANALVRSYTTINSVTIPTTVPIKPTVVFTVMDAPTGGNPVTGLTSFAFTVAQLAPEATGGISNWHSLINRNYATPPDVSVGGTTETSPNATTNAKQLTGTLTEGPAGTYTYTFGNDLSAPWDPKNPLPTYGVVSVAFDVTVPTRIGLQSSAPVPGSAPTTLANGTVINPTPPTNATFDLHTYGTTVTTSDTDPRGLVTTAKCNQCHQRLSTHGNRRLDPNYCVTCHNPASLDPSYPADSRPPVDFKRVIHKLHMGENLPSVEAGGKFIFNGEDFSDVVFPRQTSNGTSDPGDCTACHRATATESGPVANGWDNWMNKPSMVACGACHDLTYFGSSTPPAGFTLHSGGPQSDDSLCASCHAHGAPNAVDVVHTGLAAVQKTLSSKFKYTIVSVDQIKPGQTPIVTYKVTDPTNGDAAYTLAEPAWTSGAASRLFIDIAWSTRQTTAANTNYTNEGSGADPGQPVQIDAIAKKVPGTTAGTFTVTSPVPIPANAVGVGQVVMEGHPANTAVTPIGRIPVPNANKTFAITGTSTSTRRKVVDIARCNVCHGNLSLHGSNRTDLVEACVSCHNTNATDINRRPKTGTTLDNKAEESIDFKRLIHGIHGADFSGDGFVIYGFGGTANDFRGAGFPGVINNCEGCHYPGTYSASFPTANGTTTSTQTLKDPTTYLRTTPITATCSACHASGLPMVHMVQNGAGFNMTQAQIDALNQ